MSEYDFFHKNHSTDRDYPFTLTQKQGRHMPVYYIDGEADAWLGVDSDPTPGKDENPNLQALFRLIENGEPTGDNFSSLWEIQYHIKEKRRRAMLDAEFERERHRAEAERLRWEEEEARATAELTELQGRLEVLKAQGLYTDPAEKALDACTEYGGFKQPRRVVQTALPKALKAIEQLERCPLQVLLDAILRWSVHQDNLRVLAQVRILSYRSGGKIEAVPEEYLIECYAGIVTEPVCTDWRKLSDELRFDLGYFVSPSDLEGVELAPETIQIGDEKCRVEYVIDDSEAVVTVVTMQLATHQAYKNDLQEMLPDGKLRLQVTLPKGGVIEGELGDQIARRLSKVKSR